MLNRNFLFPSLIILLGAASLFIISQFDKPMFQDASVDAAFFPTVVVIAMMVISTVLIFQHWQQTKLKKNAQIDHEEPLFSKLSIFGVTYLIGYAFLIHILGYLFASLIAFTLYLIYFKVKKPLYYVIAAVFVFSVYYLFGEVFVIALPDGIIL
ncbi:tripartite tricarboxylate transporter TctB family protein [Photobacterium sp. DNB23_23_1]|uniref:Tripartite tricarboxylate transporter TctB family protein n=1 Tax=Photobacterium pectinilyticum TaxID=2906793 RepID=A0ABT1N1H5_9GAMM|nr:tripartite tricarboxylate transporter TctB family protein [Photobacterium sp. ZSDE20]MCQ1058597.1 tripartite tricarboxylate transporter TctB family protein [Photobacterium sp. ZSDE20]MDD1826281.1 tripartite tricarboxylate transporter TctB family protein [Photobacterium sp. ZSDE20]